MNAVSCLVWGREAAEETFDAEAGEDVDDNTGLEMQHVLPVIGLSLSIARIGTVSS